MPHALVIGAGIAGLACAQALQAAGLKVTVFEKSRGPGGRATTKRATVGEQAVGFDQGPLCFTAHSDEFAHAVTQWAEQGVVVAWPAATAALGETAWVATPGMSALGKHLAQGLTVQTGERVTQVLRSGAWAQTPANARPQYALVLRDEHFVDRLTAPFDAVVVATPAEQAVSLLAPVSDAARLAAAVRSDPCWSVMLAFGTSTGQPDDWLDLHGTDGAPEDCGFMVAVRDSAKPGRDPVAGVSERWVLHASAEWSVKHLEASAADVAEAGWQALRSRWLQPSAVAHEAHRPPERPHWMAAHRWRYSQPANPIRLTHVWQPQRRVGTCGDWLGDASLGGIERAWLGGRALAHAITGVAA